jgi:NAD(P)-dependent dehydrogenase (short-subunit alcohol dehydrogenase family)
MSRDLSAEVVAAQRTLHLGITTLFELPQRSSAGFSIACLRRVPRQWISDKQTRTAYFVMKHAIEIMADGGSIILTSSVSGALGVAGQTVYGATKAAVRSFGRSFARAEALVGLVVARCDTAELLEFAEEVFDEMAPSIHMEVARVAPTE